MRSGLTRGHAEHYSDQMPDPSVLDGFRFPGPLDVWSPGRRLDEGSGGRLIPWIAARGYGRWRREVEDMMERSMRPVSCLEHLKEYLGKEQVAYTTTEHPPRYTAQELAQIEHVSGRLIAKVVMLLADGKPVMTVVPGIVKVDLDAVRRALGAEDVRLVVEQEFGHLFPDSEVGAMPPFGNLYSVPVLVDAALTKDPVILFNAGSHRRTITMTYADYERLVRPAVGKFAKKLASV